MDGVNRFNWSNFKAVLMVIMASHVSYLEAIVALFSSEVSYWLHCLFIIGHLSVF